jgi:hypothetical protein
MADQTQTTMIQAACIQAAATLLASNESLQKQLMNAGDPPEAYADAVTNLAGVLFDSWVSANVPAAPM